MQLVTLKNGAQEPKMVVMTTMMNIEYLLSKKCAEKYGVLGGLAAFDLRSRARDPRYEISFPNSKDLLTRMALLDHNGLMHDLVKNVVLSAFEGEGLEMKIVNPIRE